MRRSYTSFLATREAAKNSPTLKAPLIVTGYKVLSQRPLQRTSLSNIKVSIPIS
jgi:hypothetical protein